MDQNHEDEGDAPRDNLGVVDNTEEPAGESASSESGHDEDDHMQVDLDVQPSFQPPKSTNKPLLPLQVAAGFQWSTADADMESNGSDLSDEDDAENGDRAGKKKRKKKVIEQDLTADLHTKAPESNADFERLLLGSPNSSYLWIQYMSFQLQISEVDKAREVAKKALQTIHFREEQEKLNVWVALLNLESAYGTEESLETTFKSAARANDSKTVHLRLAAILEEAENFEVGYLVLKSSLLTSTAESRGTVQANLQEVWHQLKSLDPVQRILFETGKYRRGTQTASTQSPESGKTKTRVKPFAFLWLLLISFDRPEDHISFRTAGIQTWRTGKRKNPFRGYCRLSPKADRSMVRLY